MPLKTGKIGKMGMGGGGGGGGKIGGGEVGGAWGGNTGGMAETLRAKVEKILVDQKGGANLANLGKHFPPFSNILSHGTAFFLKHLAQHTHGLPPMCTTKMFFMLLWQSCSFAQST